jgi:hypothetical protein
MTRIVTGTVATLNGAVGAVAVPRVVVECSSEQDMTIVHLRQVMVKNVRNHCMKVDLAMNNAVLVVQLLRMESPTIMPNIRK